MKKIYLIIAFLFIAVCAHGAELSISNLPDGGSTITSDAVLPMDKTLHGSTVRATVAQIINTVAQNWEINNSGTTANVPLLSDGANLWVRGPYALDTAAYKPLTYFVPSTMRVNGYTLSADITVTASDLGLGSPIVASKIISGTAYAGGCVQLSQDGTQIISLNVGCGGAGGGVTSVTASSPLASSGSGNPNITCQTASGSQAGCIAAADFATFAAKQNALGFTAENVANKNAHNGYAGLDSGGKVPYANLSGAPSITTTSPMTNTGFAIGMSAATDSVPGYLTAADHSKVTAAVPNTTTVNGHALSSNVAVTAADIGLATIGGRYLGITYLTASSGTFTTAATTGTIEIEIQASGGGGGGAKAGASQVKAAPGGNAGAYGTKTIAVSPSTGYSYSIAAPGDGGDNTGGNGAQGGSAYITIGATIITCVGGLGANGDTDTALTYHFLRSDSQSATCTNTDFTTRGAIGEVSTRLNSTHGHSGAGANSTLGAGGVGLVDDVDGTSNGYDGVGYGAGGGGALSKTTSGAVGGNGGPAIIIIRQYSN